MLPNKELAILLMEAAQCLNTLITFFSVAVIIPYYLSLPSPFGDGEDVLYMINKVAVHTLPFVFSSINMFGLTDMIAYLEDSWIVLPLIFGYMAMSYTFTKTYNRYIYMFLTWDFNDFNSNVVIFGCPFVTILAHILDCLLT